MTEAHPELGGTRSSAVPPFSRIPAGLALKEMRVPRRRSAFASDLVELAPQLDDAAGCALFRRVVSIVLGYKLGVYRGGRNQHQVLNAVIQPVAVSVVNNFHFQEWPPEVAFHDESVRGTVVLLLGALIDHEITVVVDKLTAFPPRVCLTAMGEAAARDGAVFPAPLEGSVGASAVLADAGLRYGGFPGHWVMSSSGGVEP